MPDRMRPRRKQSVPILDISDDGDLDVRASGLVPVPPSPPDGPDIEGWNDRRMRERDPVSPRALDFGGGLYGRRT